MGKKEAVTNQRKIIPEVIYDLRPASDFKFGTKDGAKNIELKRLQGELASVADKKTKVVLVCSATDASTPVLARRYAELLGFSNVETVQL